MTDISNANPLELTVTNFGPIAEANIELRPMTVFVGPSNTGKSYLAALIYALQRSLGAIPESTDHSGFSKQLYLDRLMDSLGGYALSKEDIDQVSNWLEQTILHSHSSQSPSPSLMELQDSVSEIVRSILENGDYLTPYLEREFSRCFGVETTKHLAHHPFRGNTSVSIGREGIPGTKNAINFRYRYAIDVAGANLEASILNALPMPIGEEFSGNLNLWQWLMFKFQDEEERRREAASTTLSLLATDCVYALIDPLSRRPFYLPADRTGVMHAHQVVVRALIASASRAALRSDIPMPSISGVLGDFLEQIVTFASASQQESGSYDDLAHHLERKLLGGAVRVERSEINYPSFVYRPDGWERDLPLMNTSSMVSELAPVVLYLRHLVRPGNLLIIEEPEAHLHPEMQAIFTRQLVAAVQSGVRILITTHSEWILEELANLVRLSELPLDRREGIEDPEIALNPDQLGTWFFEPNEETGGSVVREISLDKESATFPAGFGLVTESLYNRWVEISTRIQEG